MADSKPTKDSVHDSTSQTEWTRLLAEAVNTPGTIMQAYSNFWSYSVGNQLLALAQCYARKMPVGPIASFNRWKELGRYVKRGERAITLCMPVTWKQKDTADDGNEIEVSRFRFVFKRNWFVLSQTDGAEYVPPQAPGWDRSRALEALSIAVVP